MDSDPHPQQTAEPEAEPRRPPRRGTTLVSTLTVVGMVVAALAAAVMTTRQEEHVAQQARSAVPAPAREVVKAPPLVVTAPPLAPVKPQARMARSGGTDSMGAAAACANCGVVETVSAGPNKGFRMRIRMDDGSLRTVEQRGALPAGTRVALEGSSVRLMPKPG